VLDAGGGSGELALRLAQRGYRVWLLDYAPAMLDQARYAALSLSHDAQARLNFRLLPAEEASNAFAPGFFQVITCHTLVEYLHRPQVTIGELVSLLSDGGLLSLSFVNRHAEVLRQVWSHSDPAGALARLKDGSFCAGLFDIPGQAYTAEEVSTWLPPVGLTLTAVCGVRAFVDQVPEERLDEPAFLDALLRLESAAAPLDPYRRIARYMHLLARKDVELS
jgi:S-adenosylmethionine-dependent methyltransferase